MTVLAAVEVISDLISGWYILMCCSAIFCLSGALCIKFGNKDKRYREANFWVWLTMYSISLVGTLIELISYKEQL